MEWVLMFVPMGVQILAFKLIAKDKNDIGFDDAMGQVLIDISPNVPELIAGRSINDSAADRTMLAIFRTSEAYLRRRKKLPGMVTEPPVEEIAPTV